MQDGWKSLHGFLCGIEWIKLHGHWIVFKKHLLEVDLTQNWETMALRKLTTGTFFYNWYNIIYGNCSSLISDFTSLWPKGKGPRLRARDQCTSNTLIGGKGKAGASSLLHTTLEGAMEWVCECKMHGKSTWISMWHRMDEVAWSLDRFQKTSLGGRSNTKLGDHGSPNVPNHYLFLLVYHGGGPAWTKIHRNSICLRAQSRMNLDGTWGSVTSLHDFGGVLIGPWTLLFGLTQFQTISWSWLLVCVWNGPK